MLKYAVFVRGKASILEFALYLRVLISASKTSLEKERKTKEKKTTRLGLLSSTTDCLIKVSITAKIFDAG